MKLNRLLLALLVIVSGCGKHSPTLPAPDLTAPAPITGLSARTVSDTSVRLDWRLPSGSDIVSYEIRFTTDPLALATEGGWNGSGHVVPPPINDLPPFFALGGLKEATTYYFAIRGRDAAGNTSPSSNIVSSRTFESAPTFIGQWGSRGSAAGQFMAPTAIAVGDGLVPGVYVADDGNHRIQSFDGQGSFVKQWGSYCDLSTGQGCVDPDGSGPLALGDGQFGQARGIAVDFAGNVYVADFTNSRVVKYTHDGEYLAKWSVPEQPTDIDIDAAGNVYVAGYDEVSIYDASLALVSQVHVPLEGTIGVAADGRGRLFALPMFADFATVYEFSTSGALLTHWGGLSLGNCSQGQVFVPNHLAADGSGSVYVPDGCGRVQKFDATGAFQGSWGGSGGGDGQFDYPRDIAISGDLGYLYVLEDSANPAVSQTRIQKFASPHAMSSRLVRLQTAIARQRWPRVR